MARSSNTISSAVSTPQESEDSRKFKLKRKLGLWDAVAIVAGTVVGSGIFVSPVGVLAGSNGSVGVSLVLWVACGLFCALVALCYAELGTAILESGSEYTYLNAAYGGPVAFMYAISVIFISLPASRATNAIIFGTYLAKPFYEGCDPPIVVIKCAGAAAVMIIGLLNYFSVRSVARVQIVFTIIKFAGMTIIIIAGFKSLAMGERAGMTNFQNAFNPNDLAGITAGGISIAFYQGLYAYMGWSNLNRVSEEVENVKKTLPRAIITSMALVTVYYIAINVAYFAVLTPTDMLSSKAVAFTFASKVSPSAAWLMPVVVACSVFGGLNGAFLSGARVIFTAGRRGHLPQVLSMAHVTHNTPGPAIIIQVAMCLLLMIPGDIDALISMFNFTVWIYYGLCAASVFVLRRKYPDLHRPYKVPAAVPIIVCVCALFLIVYPLVSNLKLQYAYGLAVMLSTPFIYYAVVYRKYKVPGFDPLTVFLQLTLDIAPTDWEDNLEENRKD